MRRRLEELADDMNGRIYGIAFKDEDDYLGIIK
jgi:hypothetical protein